ncbi:MAG: sigma 54-interacting transcriptional regulator [Sandaracinaceae bacterium]|nr:sigma 54-interacting transcriptional regulator [Sandaracinaceae bacterium]
MENFEIRNDPSLGDGTWTLSETLVASALSQLGGAVLLLDQNLVVRAYSREAKEVLGGGLRQGIRAVEILCGDRIERPVAQAMARGEAIQATVVRPLVDGRLQHLFVRANPLGIAPNLLGYVIRLEEVDPTIGGDAPEVLEGIATRSPKMKQVFRIIRRAALRDATVLVRGESGVGKELVARAIHRLSPRRKGPFKAINCAALPPTLLESELFGYKRGAFTGAVRDYEGIFRAAHGGTLFLDEVAEMPLELQAKLLRVLETRTVTPIGSQEAVEVDVRIVAATHRSLRQLVNEGKFRADLMYRLRVVPIRIPPLRERPEDILFLAGRLLEDLQANGPARPEGPVTRIEPEAERAMLNYSWPGNVRELRNALEYALVVGEREAIGLNDLPEEIVYGEGGNDHVLTISMPNPLPQHEENAERMRIERALSATAGHIGRAAQSLGISRTTLWRKMKKLGIKA